MFKKSWVRSVDEIGRIVIPAEVLRDLGIQKNDPVHIVYDGETVIPVKK